STIQPLRYINEVASTNTFKSSKLNTLSIMPPWFSKAIEYWNPEQPPPTTPMRSPAGRGSCVAMISRTLAMAWGVNVRGAFLISCSGVAAVVAMKSPNGEIRSSITVLGCGPGNKTCSGNRLIACPGQRTRFTFLPPEPHTLYPAPCPQPPVTFVAPAQVNWDYHVGP